MSIEFRPEMDALLGAYVLDALESDESALVETYVEENPRARAEVDDLRETVAVLAAAPGVEGAAPSELWDRIAAQVTTEVPATDRAATDEVVTMRSRRASRRSVAIASAFAAIAAAVAVVLGLQVVSLNDDLDEAKEPSTENIAATYEEATAVEGAREATFESDREVARVVMLPDGTGYWVNEDLEPLDESETYQLWALVGDGTERRIISAGVLGSDPEAVAFKLDGPVAGFALSVEGAGGSPAPTQDPFALAQFA